MGEERNSKGISQILSRWLYFIDLQKTLRYLVAVAGFPMPFVTVQLYIPASVLVALMMLILPSAECEIFKTLPTFVHVATGRGIPSLLQSSSTSFPSVTLNLLVRGLMMGASAEFKVEE